MKRTISKSNFEFLAQELTFAKKQGIVTSEQLQSILSNYEVKVRFNFIRVLLIIGSLLVGVGILSFIAANWSAFSNSFKLAVIFISLIGFYLAGWKTETSHPKTSKSLYIIGLFVYGAGIFLIGQMFNLGSDSQNAFLAWAVGALPLAMYLKDKWVALIGLMLMGIYAIYSWDTMDPYPWGLLVLIPLVYWFNGKQLNQSRLIFFGNNLLSIYFILYTAYKLTDQERILSIILFIIGLAMVFVPIAKYKKLLEWQGSLYHGIAGIILTFPEYWDLWLDGRMVQIVSFGFVIGYVLFLIYLLKVGSLPAILIICSLIIRYYIDLSYDFLPKSLFFIIGGVLLISFGFWFEQKRRRESKS